MEEGNSEYLHPLITLTIQTGYTLPVIISGVFFRIVLHNSYAVVAGWTLRQQNIRIYSVLTNYMASAYIQDAPIVCDWRQDGSPFLHRPNIVKIFQKYPNLVTLFLSHFLLYKKYLYRRRDSNPV